MLTYTGARNLYGTYTSNTSSDNLTQGDILINEGIRKMLGKIAWPFLEDTATLATVAAQQAYSIPAEVDKIISVSVTVGTYKYQPDEISSIVDWDNINTPTTSSGDNTSYYFVYDGQIKLWPIPATSSNTITVSYQRKVRDINVADYTTGTIVSIANGGTALVGSGTSWTTGMAGKYIRITHTSAANVGDGLWYPIASVGSSTTITLGRPYDGTAIAAGSAAYTIGDIMAVPEKYQMGPVFYAASEYWNNQDNPSRADRNLGKYNALLDQMTQDEGMKTTNRVIDEGYGSVRVMNPNLNPRIT